MAKLTATIVLLFLFILCFPLCSSTSADDTLNVVVTGGTASAHYCCSMSFNFIGPGFTANGGADRYIYVYRDGTQTITLFPGSSVRVRTYHSDFFGTNTATVNGVTHYPVYYSGSLEFNSGPVTLPDVQAREIAVTMPFTMTGEMWAYSISSMSATTNDQLFYAKLSGEGVVTMKFTGYMDFNNRWVYELQSNSITYNFQPAPSQPETVRFSSATYSVNEGVASGVATVTVNRVGGSFSSSTVDYTTASSGGQTPCQNNSSGSASERCDYTTTVDTLRFAPGETSKTIQIPIVNDAYVEGNEVFSIALQNPQGERLGANAAATVIIQDDDTQTATQNPINNQAFFIRQQYVDFLGRVAEPAGFQFWNNRMNNCPAGQVCDRIDTSMRFFQSDEFQARGFFLYRLFDAVLGYKPYYDWFVTLMSRFNGTHTVTEQRQIKDDFLREFVMGNDFKLVYRQYLSLDGLTATDPAGLVNAICAKAGVTPSSKQTLIDNLQSGAKDVAHTVEDFINTPEISGVGTKFYDRGFITMQYFGYLRRDPDQAGFDFWQSQLIGPNAPHRGDYRFMVGGFLQSDEYNFRFALIRANP